MINFLCLLETNGVKKKDEMKRADQESAVKTLARNDLLFYCG